MCCEHESDHGDVPHVVATMLAGYRELHDGIGFDWGAEGMDVFAHARFAPFGDLLREVGRLHRAGRSATLADGLFTLVHDSPPHGLAIVEVDHDGPVVRGSSFGHVIAGSIRRGAFLIRSGVDDETEVAINGDRHVLAPHGARLVDVTVDWDHTTVTIGALGRDVTFDTVEPRATATLRLRSAAPCRWSVRDDLGGGWFPADALEKWDFHGRPWFHGDDVTMAVPSGMVTVVASRAIEHRSVTMTVDLEPGACRDIELTPPRRFDPSAAGWYGGDLHVHLNYSGDHVATPAFAAAAQVGEGLHLMNLVAGNLFTARIYDREAFEHFAGRDLPWSSAERVARWGVEYRNDLLGHVHALNPRAAPTRFQTGHERSAEPDDWPPNAVACAELRSLGATVGYTHPVSARIDESSAPVFTAMPRSTEARELVADAALGLVDSMDLLGPTTLAAGSVALYHRLLNAGIRLAATAGTDTMLSLARAHTFSNPPGWARAYADLRGASLSVEAWQDAVRRGRTMVTNGPWLTLHVRDHGPGDVVDVPPGTTLPIVVRCTGDEVRTLSLLGPDGPIRQLEVVEACATLEAELVIDAPCWLAAAASGPRHDDVLGAEVYAHTSPVHVEVDGRRIARAADAAWCLDWLDRLEALATAHGHFADDAQLEDLRAVLDAARGYYTSITA